MMKGSTMTLARFIARNFASLTIRFSHTAFVELLGIEPAFEFDAPARAGSFANVF